MNPVKIFPVTITYGESKPQNLDFFAQYCQRFKFDVQFDVHVVQLA